MPAPLILPLIIVAADDVFAVMPTFTIRQLPPLMAAFDFASARLFTLFADAIRCQRRCRYVCRWHLLMLTHVCCFAAAADISLLPAVTLICAFAFTPPLIRLRFRFDTAYAA